MVGLVHVFWLILVSMMIVVRLGNSGLKVSRIILGKQRVDRATSSPPSQLFIGCMTYGSPDWEGWVLGEKEAFEHIKYAYVLSSTPSYLFYSFFHTVMTPE
jgi:hypothetical protein